MGIFLLFFAVTNLEFPETPDQLKAHLRRGRKRFGNARLERSRSTTAGLALTRGKRSATVDHSVIAQGLCVRSSVPPLLGSGPEPLGHGGYYRAHGSFARERGNFPDRVPTDLVRASAAI
jgi:hypothetical protein